MNTIIDKIMALRQEYYSMEGVIDHSTIELNNDVLNDHDDVYHDDTTTIMDQSSVEFNPMLYPELLRIRKDMSCLSLELAHKVSSFIIEYEISEGSKKIEFSKKHSQLMGPPDRMNASKAKSYAEVHIEDHVQNSHLNKGMYMAGKLVLNQVNEVLKSLNQDISIIRKEYESIAK